MRRIKKVLPAIVALGLAVGVCTASLYASSKKDVNAFSPDSLVRLHVVANSDSETDQNAKLAVRDAVLKAMEPLLLGLASSDDAYRFLIKNEDVLRSAIQAGVVSSGLSQPYRLEFGVFDFPDRVYSQKYVPAGRYRAVRVLLGEAKGQNWWCVLFPPMCFKDLTQETKTSEAKPAVKNDLDARERVVLAPEDSMTTVKREYRLKVVEWARARKTEIMAKLARTQRASN